MIDHENVDPPKKTTPKRAPAKILQLPSNRTATPALSRTELGIQDRVFAKHGKNIRYSPAAKTFYIWNSRYWQDDTTGTVASYCREVITNDLVEEAKAETDMDKRKEIFEFVARSQTQQKINNCVKGMMDLCAFDYRVLDQHKFMLNVRNGTIDLPQNAGDEIVLRPFNRDDYLTVMLDVDYDPSAKCLRWERFTAWTSNDDPELLAFKRRLFGSMLCEDNSDQAFVIAFGTGSRQNNGSNGKTTEYEVLRKLLGGYATSLNPDTLMQKQNADSRSASPDLLALRGKRLAVAGEGEKNQHLANALVKRFTGGDTVVARDLYKGSVEFTPHATLVYHTNAKPVITDLTAGMWRRLKPIVYKNTMLEADGITYKAERIKNFDDVLLAEEASGILNWLLAGYIAWRADGLGSCQSVDDEKRAYMAEMNIIGAFINEMCVTNAQCKVTVKALYLAYREWCAETGVNPIKKMRFKDEMEQEGFKHRTNGNGGYDTWFTIGLTAEYPHAVNEDPNVAPAPVTPAPATQAPLAEVAEPEISLSRMVRDAEKVYMAPITPPQGDNLNATWPSIPPDSEPAPAPPIQFGPHECGTCHSGTTYPISPVRNIWACNNPECPKWRNPRDSQR